MFIVFMDYGSPYEGLILAYTIGQFKRKNEVEAADGITRLTSEL